MSPTVFFVRLPLENLDVLQQYWPMDTCATKFDLRPLGGLLHNSLQRDFLDILHQYICYVHNYGWWRTPYPNIRGFKTFIEWNRSLVNDKNILDEKPPLINWCFFLSWNFGPKILDIGRKWYSKMTFATVVQPIVKCLTGQYPSVS